MLIAIPYCRNRPQGCWIFGSILPILHPVMFMRFGGRWSYIQTQRSLSLILRAPCQALAVLGDRNCLLLCDFVRDKMTSPIIPIELPGQVGYLATATICMVLPTTLVILRIIGRRRTALAMNASDLCIVAALVCYSSSSLSL